MSFSPNLFLANMNAKGGPAKPSRFEVILPLPTYIANFVEQGVLERILNLPTEIFTRVEDAIGSVLGANQESGPNSTNYGGSSISRYLALQCEAAELPGKSLLTSEAKIYGPVFKVPYQTQYTETTLTFLCSNEFYERKLFERYMEAIMPHDTNNLRFPRGRETRYYTNITIIQYDEFIKKIYSVELRDAYPVAIAAQPLSWADDGFHRLSVQFAYQRYITKYDGAYDLGQAAGAIFGSKGADVLKGVLGKSESAVRLGSQIGAAAGLLGIDKSIQGTKLGGAITGFGQAVNNGLNTFGRFFS